MKISPSVAAKNNLVIDYMNSIPDITAVKTGELSGEITVKNHAPLDKIAYGYICKARFWTKDYDLKYEASADTEYPDGQLELKNNRFITKSVKTDIISLSDRLNKDEKLSAIIKRLDILRLAINICDKKACISLITMTFGITKMLIPPLTHMIKPSGRECVDSLQLMQVLSFFLKT